MGNLVSCSTPSAIAVSSTRRAVSPACGSVLQRPTRVGGGTMQNSWNSSKSKKEVAEGGAMKEVEQGMQVARVLLVDGSVLQFRQQMKVLKVLAHYPDHFICPLDSLRPGHHSLPMLLPHDHLHLGRLYLLLPLHHHPHHSPAAPSSSASPITRLRDSRTPRAAHHHDHPPLQHCITGSDHPRFHAPAAAPHPSNQHDHSHSAAAVSSRRRHSQNALSSTPRSADQHDPLLLQCRKIPDHPHAVHPLAAAYHAHQHSPMLLQCRKGSDHPRVHGAVAADHDFSKVNMDSRKAQDVGKLLQDPDHHQQQLQVPPLGCKKRSVYPIHACAHADFYDNRRPPLKEQKFRSHVGRSKHVADHGYGDGTNSTSAAASCAAAQSNDQHHRIKCFSPLQDDQNRPSYMGIMDKPKRCSSSRSSNSSRIIGAGDTPELKIKTYNSDKLRRCRSWTPRLHAITETRSTS